MESELLERAAARARAQDAVVPELHVQHHLGHGRMQGGAVERADPSAAREALPLEQRDLVGQNVDLVLGRRRQARRAHSADLGEMIGAEYLNPRLPNDPSARVGEGLTADTK